MTVAIEAERLVKRFGEQTVLDDLSFTVDEGTVLGVLGPNGSGKTTAVKAVTGLYRLDSGQARIFGRSVIQNADEVKQFTGFSGQYAAVDEDLSTAENLVLVGRLYGHSKSDARRRADQLIDAFDMGTYARKRVGQHSGGMRRRVDLACALVGDPRVLVLDEPTTGLDPTSRQGLWQMIQELVAGGMTLLLTTQYLEEADVLADQVLVIAEGRQVAFGTPDELKGRLGGDRVQVELASPEQDERTAVRSVQTLLNDSNANITASDGHLIFRTHDAARKLVPCVNALTEAGVAIDGISVQQPTLDDVFFALTRDSNSAADDVRVTERSE
ncbi:ATP-binding cassette domain-containing protein [Kocuria atrinae]|uniref:Daunorubicin resistance protein DrrA family ABC transporter ATP-binding protein n=1 Tax=Kocuria atrinae TaxID=592377 RepID=A0ABN2Y4S6_9MICC